MATLKQKKLLEVIAENERKPASKQKSARQLIKEAGYSQEAANHPGKVIKTKSWIELVNQIIPKEKILYKLADNALQGRSIHGSNAAIDISLKVVGGYAAQKVQLTTPQDEMTDEELIAQEKKLEEEIKKRKRIVKK